MSLLQVKNVSKYFGSLVAVNDISMTVEPGELRAIIGPNGAGKTTFFNLITGFFTPSAGRIIFDGRDVSASPDRHFLARVRPRTRARNRR
jgi:branched-chain amino acid transport system ATP-binding protein